jgi:sporulation-control protein spo0M
MGFSEKMRDSLGGEGAKIEVVPPSDAVAPGDTARFAVVIVGGSKAAAVDALTLRLVQAVRHWVDASGNTHDEDSVDGEARLAMTAGWTRTTCAEWQMPLTVTVEPGMRHTIEVELAVPPDAVATSAACTHALSVQADIKGQIDPTGQARVQLA